MTLASYRVCKHNSGKDPAICQYNSVSTESNCEVKCNAYEWCIAYSYKGPDKICKLVTSTGSCNSGTAVKYPDYIAESTAELKEGEWTRGWNCMLKPVTGIKLLLHLGLLLGVRLTTTIYRRRYLVDGITSSNIYVKIFL